MDHINILMEINMMDIGKKMNVKDKDLLNKSMETFIMGIGLKINEMEKELKCMLIMSFMKVNGKMIK